MSATLPPVVAKRPLVLVGCGILHQEVDFLITGLGD